MNVQVLFFGATANITGRRSHEIELPSESVAKTVFDKILIEYPRLATHRLLFSVNQQYATGNEMLSDGDELGIFTAVSGG